MPTDTSTPTLEQLLNLADRAEYNGGLTHAEANRLRAGLRTYGLPIEAHVAELRRSNWDLGNRLGRVTTAHKSISARFAALRQNNRSLSNRLWRATTAHRTTVDAEAHAAVHRVTALAQRWSFIPAKRQAAAAILAALHNKDTDD